MATESPDLFPYLLPEAQFWLSGSFTAGGKAEVRDGKLKAQLRFSPTEFAVLAILMKAAQRSAKDAPWTPKGFLTTEGLKNEIKRQASLAEPDQVVKYIWRIRKKLSFAVARVAPRSFNVREWAEQFLETDLGYRISIPPDRLMLCVVADPLDHSFVFNPGIEKESAGNCKKTRD